MSTTGNNTSDVYWEGFRLHQEGNHEAAIEKLTEAIRLNPTLPAAYQSRAQSLRQLGRIAEADADKAKAAELTRMQQVTSGASQFRPELSYNEDTAGPGKYILSFLFAGIIGLGIQYALRKQGWWGVGVNVAIGVVAVILLSATG